MSESNGNPNIVVEITNPREFHCFRLLLNPKGHSPTCSSAADPEALCTCNSLGEGMRIEIMLHARSLVDLIHKCNETLCQWQKATTDDLLEKLTRYGR